MAVVISDADRLEVLLGLGGLVHGSWMPDPWIPQAEVAEQVMLPSGNAHMTGRRVGMVLAELAARGYVERDPYVKRPRWRLSAGLGVWVNEYIEFPAPDEAREAS